jgi:hypothetical protein
MAPELLHLSNGSLDVDTLSLYKGQEKLNGICQRILFFDATCFFSITATLPYTKGYQADVYALAIVFLDLADPTNRGFHGLRRLREDSRPTLPPGLNPRVSELIHRMWDARPSTRPLCKDILNTLRIPDEARESENEFFVTSYVGSGGDADWAKSYPWFDSASQSSVDTSTTTITMRQQPSVNMDTDDSNTSSSAIVLV